MVAIPTLQDEDAKRPNREHESLVGEQSRIINRMKATLIRGPLPHRFLADCVFSWHGSGLACRFALQSVRCWK
jgi:hypothetical protein